MHNCRQSLITAAGAILLLLMAFPAAGHAQQSSDLEVDAVSARGNDTDEGTRLDVYARIPYSSLRFINTSKGFSASYDVSLEVYALNERNRPQNMVLSRIWDQSVLAADFAQTQTDQLHDRTVQSVHLKPGKYLLTLQLEDRTSHETHVREIPVVVRNLDRPLALGDLILIEQYDPRANSISPTIGNRLQTDLKSFKLFYEIYTDKPRRVLVTREVVRVRKSSGPPSIMSLLGFGSDDEDASPEVSYQESEPRLLQRGRNPFVIEIPLDNFKVGEFIARVGIEEEGTGVVDMAEKVIELRWSGLAEHVRNVDEAIAQLQYIAKSKELSRIREGGTEAERLARFRAFWAKRDPTPGTDRNERMEEYYYRIAFANRQYGNFGAGWKTDRGLVLVKFGEPDYIERHPFNFNVKPYEVWYYYGIGRRFIFVDETGMGDFELLVPYWDERTRIR